MTRIGRTAALLAAIALGLTGCQTTGNQPPSGAVVGGVTGAAMGAGTGVGGSSLLGALVGVVAGAVIGSYVIDGPATPLPTLSEADQKIADRAAGEAADAGIGKRVPWKSGTDDSISGWSEAYHVDRPAVGKGVPGKECRKAMMHYAFGERARLETTVFCRENGQWVRS